jgi:hypothetical protein
LTYSCLKNKFISFIKNVILAGFFFQIDSTQNNMSLKTITLGFSFFLTTISFGQVSLNKAHDVIIEEFLTNCAEKNDYNVYMDKWQACLDEGLKKDSTVAQL